MPRSNIPERGDGLELYRREVKPAVTDVATVGAHYALCSLFDAYAKQARVYCYQVQAEDFQAAEAGKARLVVGRAQVTSEITLESDVFGFAALHLGNHNLNGGVKKFSDIGSYETMAAELTSLFAGADFAETIRALDRNFRGSLYTLKSLFRDDQGKLLGHILRATLEEAEAVYRQLYEHHAPLLKFLKDTAPEGLLESELFGHVRGAFTGAHASKRGLFEKADGGTLFLDEIGDMGLVLQGKLLRVLQDREIRPVGWTQSVRVDVRIIAATNRDLKEEVSEGRFRKDLFFRVNGVKVVIPPLRERPEDIPLLVDHFSKQLPSQKRLTAAALAALSEYDWPGNVRELHFAVERAGLLAEGEMVDVADLPPEIVEKTRRVPAAIVPSAPAAPATEEEIQRPDHR